MKAMTKSKLRANFKYFLSYLDCNSRRRRLHAYRGWMDDGGLIQLAEWMKKHDLQHPLAGSFLCTSNTSGENSIRSLGLCSHRSIVNYETWLQTQQNRGSHAFCGLSSHRHPCIDMESPTCSNPALQFKVSISCWRYPSWSLWVSCGVRDK